MAGILQKTLLPSVYHPAVPGQTIRVWVPGATGSPTRTVYDNTGIHCVSVYNPEETYQRPIGHADFNQFETVVVPAYYTVFCSGTSNYVTYPSTPASFGQYVDVYDFGKPGYYTTGGSRIGWDSGARTIGSLAHSGIFKFTFQGVSAVVGLVEQDVSTAPSEASHAFYLTRNAYVILERGVAVFTGVVLAATDVLSIQRVFNRVDYLVNGVVTYTSLRASTGQVYLDATMYVSGDTVSLIEITPTNPIAVAFTSAPAVLQIGASNAIAFTALPMQMSMVTLPRISVSFTMEPAVFSVSDRFFSAISFTALPATLHVNTGAVVLSPPFSTIFFEALPAEFGVSDGGNPMSLRFTAAPAALKMGQGDYFEMSFQSLPAVLSITFGINGEMNFNEYSGAIDTMSAQSLLSVSFNEQFAVMGSVSFSGLLDAMFNETMAASMGATLQSILTTMFDASVGIVGGSGGTAYTGGQRSATAWVTNLDTGAVSMYAGFDFDRMYELDGKYYGVRDTNTYVLDGDTDNGAPIDAFVAFGKQTFGTSALKHVPNFYAGVSSTGVLLLRVSTGAQTYTYTPRRTDAISKTQRYDLGKGLRANYYEFELFNQNGCDFELDSVEFLALPSGRRI